MVLYLSDSEAKLYLPLTIIPELLYFCFLIILTQRYFFIPFREKGRERELPKISPQSSLNVIYLIITA